MENQAIPVTPTNPEEKKVWDEKAINEFMEEQKKAIKKCTHVWIGVMAYLLIIGIVACFIVYGVLMLGMFVVNLIFFLKTQKFLKSFENGEVDLKTLYGFYEKMGSRALKLFTLNLLCGGLFGVIGSIYEMRIAGKALPVAEEILGDDFKEERKAADPNAQWHYCIYCKKNKREGNHLFRLKDGVICKDCLDKYCSMLPKRSVDPMLVKGNGIASIPNIDRILPQFALKDLEDRLEYLKQNNEQYSDFTPTKVICDGCLELDEAKSLFRVVRADEDIYNSAKNGMPSGLIHPYSVVKGICYEMVYEYEQGYGEDSVSKWEYKDTNTIVLAIEDKYLKEEVFTLNKVPTETGWFANTKKPQIDYAEQTVKELQELFNKPALPARKLH